MLAAYFTGQKEFDVREVEKPQCPPDGFLLKVHACAICGTDLKIINQADVKMEKGKQRSMSLPRITGHEFSGIIDEVGKDTQEFAAGEKVVIAPTIPCLKCSMCQKGFFEMCNNVMVVGYDYDGGFAEYCVVERKVINGRCVIQTNDIENLDSFAVAEPLSCAINCFSLSPVKEGDTVAIMGAGPLGCFITELAKIYGAAKTILTDISQNQLTHARVCNPDEAFQGSGDIIIQRILDSTTGNGAELVITACPSPKAQQDALSVVAKRGSINFFGGLPRNNSVVNFNTNLIHYKECMITGTHGSRPKQVKEAVELIKSNKIDMTKYISHRYPLNDINEAFEKALRGNRLKIIIKP